MHNGWYIPFGKVGMASVVSPSLLCYPCILLGVWELGEGNAGYLGYLKHKDRKWNTGSLSALIVINNK